VERENIRKPTEFDEAKPVFATIQPMLVKRVVGFKRCKEAEPFGREGIGNKTLIKKGGKMIKEYLAPRAGFEPTT
jgi:hypothetical protein